VRPNSSLTSDWPLAAWRVTKSPITFALLSAALANDSASATGSYCAGAFCGGGWAGAVLLSGRVSAAVISGLLGPYCSRLSSAAAKAQDAAVGGTRESPGMPEVVQVGDRLAHREKALLQVERAPEQHRQHFRRGDQKARRGLELGQAGDVVGTQLHDAGADPDEGQAV